MVLSLTDKIVGFLIRPVETFRAVREEELAPPMIYFLVLLIIGAILRAIVAYLGLAAVDANTPNFTLGLGGSIGAFIGALIIAFIVGIIGLLLWAVFLHIGAKIMSGRGDFADSFKSAVYAQTPSLLLGWIPIISIIFTIWSIVLLFFGVRELHDLDTMKAAIAIVVAVVLFIIVIAILGFLGFAFLSGIAGLASVPGITSPT